MRCSIHLSYRPVQKLHFTRRHRSSSRQGRRGHPPNPVGPVAPPPAGVGHSRTRWVPTWRRCEASGSFHRVVSIGSDDESGLLRQAGPGVSSGHVADRLGGGRLCRGRCNRCRARDPALGGGFAVVKSGDAVTTLDFRETAPRAASHDMFLDPDGEVIPDASLVGGLAAGVPGSPAGLFELHHRHGSLPWRAVVEPALRLARDGFTVSQRLHDAVEWETDLLARFPETAAVWLPEGKPPAPGSVMRLPELAATLAAYAERGPEAIMSGSIASAVASASREHGGVLTTADLSDYRPIWREPLRFRAFGWEVASMRLPSSGGFILAQSFGMLEHLGWDRLPREGVERLHLLAEVWRRAYSDRFLLGDPARMPTDVSRLLGPEWIAARAAGIDRARATPSAQVYPWPGREAGEAAATMHLSVADGTGEMVALTSTLNGWFGCGVYVKGAGFLLNNEMDDCPP
ncbi:MAG: hypothetical protein DMF51_16390 [Acidobacteria bacterium]|nr:MAG: hypothetical protein DMF51_16390 [Acidobacteriota bacterium]